MKRTRTIIISALVILLLGTTLARLEIEPAEQGTVPPSSSHTTADQIPPPTESSPDSEAVLPPDAPPADTPPSEPDEPVTDALPEATDAPVTEIPPQETPPEPPVEPPPEERRYYCTVEIRCDTVTDTSKLENEAVIPYIPADGTILAATEVEFTPGETAFDVLKRATRDNNVHLEFRQDNVYTGGVNIEGIGYLYDFDGGPLSGWMYKVNEQFPNRGTAGFLVSDGDALVWVYTCDLGVDVGDNSTW